MTAWWPEPAIPEEHFETLVAGHSTTWQQLSDEVCRNALRNKLNVRQLCPSMFGTADQLFGPSFSAKETEEKVGAWLDALGGKPLPTAFLVGGDFMAAGTINALQQRGLRVPQDVSVMSIDGFNLAAIQDVPLTAIHVPREELGVEAVQMLQQRLIRPEAPCGSLLLHGQLAVRESVRRIRPGTRRTAVEREGLYDD